MRIYTADTIDRILQNAIHDSAKIFGGSHAATDELRSVRADFLDSCLPKVTSNGK